MKKIGYILLFSFVMVSCKQQKDTICGVPVMGTPWELATSINDQGDGSFIPESVSVFGDKAYIRGGKNTNIVKTPYREAPFDDGYLSAEIVCDIQNGKVIHAFGFYNSIKNNNDETIRR